MALSNSLPVRWCTYISTTDRSYLTAGYYSVGYSTRKTALSRMSFAYDYMVCLLNVHRTSI